jgi:hypothetical protein
VAAGYWVVARELFDQQGGFGDEVGLELGLAESGGRRGQR